MLRRLAMQVIVLGMHRSGTSMLARVLGLMGCYAGPEEALSPPDGANPHGYWERRDVWAVNEAILQALGKSWYDVAGLDLSRLQEKHRSELEDRARSIVRALDDHRPWVIKDPRLCVLFPFWRKLLDRPVCVLIDRDPLAVARSLQARDGFPRLFGIALWEYYTLQALLSTRHLARIAVSYHDLLAKPAATAHFLREALSSLGVMGLHDHAEGEIAAFVEPALQHHDQDETGLRGYLNAQQLDLQRAVSNRVALDREPPPLSPGAEDLLIVHPRVLAEREELRAKIIADTPIYLAERAARLGCEQELVSVAAEAEALRAKVASDAVIYMVEQENFYRELAGWSERVAFMEGTRAWRLRQRIIDLKGALGRVFRRRSEFPAKE
jgi:hypothetical protein